MYRKFRLKGETIKGKVIYFTYRGMTLNERSKFLPKKTEEERILFALTNCLIDYEGEVEKIPYLTSVKIVNGILKHSNLTTDTLPEDESASWINSFEGRASTLCLLYLKGLDLEKLGECDMYTFYKYLQVALVGAQKDGIDVAKFLDIAPKPGTEKTEPIKAKAMGDASFKTPVAEDGAMFDAPVVQTFSKGSTFNEGSVAFGKET